MYLFCPVPGIPEQIKALAMTSDSIMVTWARPSELNGIIIKYNVYIQHSNKVSYFMFFLSWLDIFSFFCWTQN